MGENVSGTSRITLLVPTMNRSAFLIRMLRYYADLGFRGYLCIGDSSSKEHVERTKRAIDLLSGKLNIIYREYPHIKDPQCMQQLVNLIPTPYAAYLGDDDFLVPGALEQCALSLESHPYYSAMHGLAVTVSREPSGALYSAPYVQPVIEGETASQRLLDHLRNYSVLLFSVRRVESWRLIYADISSAMDRAFAGELLPGCLSVIQGKVKELDCFYMVRQVHPQRYGLPDTYTWITGDQWQASYVIFRERLSQLLVQKDGISLDQARTVVEQGFRSYLAKGMMKDWQNGYGRNGSGLYSKLRDIARRIPRLRRIRNRMRSFLPGKTNYLSLDALIRPSSPYHDDFRPIYEAVIASTEQLEN